MVIEQPGAPAGTEQPGSSSAPSQQMTASQPGKAPKVPSFAAFGTSGGAAIVFRDLASI
jgi:hypothetical protein